MTTTVRIIEDEAYPDYFLDRPDDARIELDVPDEVAERWRAAREAWDAAVEEINVAYRSIEYPSADVEPPYPGRRV